MTNLKVPEMEAEKTERAEKFYDINKLPTSCICNNVAFNSIDVTQTKENFRVFPSVKVCDSKCRPIFLYY
jgi:hypothetical protein